jgi:predicted nucleic acid-binding protein
LAPSPGSRSATRPGPALTCALTCALTYALACGSRRCRRCRWSTSPRRLEDRAVEVLTLLADRGQHRAPSVPDLIIAAAAELAGLTVLHCDKDFDLIASVTGQPAEWLIAS